MKTYNFVITVSGSAKGNVKANSKNEALKKINGGQWDDIDIDVEDVSGVEYLEEGE